MKSTMLRLLGLAALLILGLAACGGGLPGNIDQKTGEIEKNPDGPVELTGTYSITNDFIFTYYVENAVALFDLHGFVIRDQEWELPVDSQVLGFMTYNPETKGGTFNLGLPAVPRGFFNDVDHDRVEDRGVQVFAVAYSPNQYGGPFSEGNDRSRGWPDYLASIKTDSERRDEVVGGKLIIWAADATQEFPSGFGADGLLFTDDDPVTKVPPGYSVVDLDQQPFTIERKPQVELRLYEPTDVAIKDFSQLSYTEAFEQTFQIIRREYAFNGIDGKEPAWASLYAELRPRIEQAEQDGDAHAFYLALRDLTWAFRDGHVSLQAGDHSSQDFSEATSGGYGFSVRELDDGRILVTFVLEGGPAAEARMEAGAEILMFNGEPVAEAIGKTQIYALQSSEIARRYQQARYLLRARPGDTATITFVNPDGVEREAALTAVAERESFSRTSLYYGVNTDPLLPVDSQLIAAGNAQVGYIRINSNFDDLNLVIRLFERALKEFIQREVAGIIIDMRYNSGGANLGLAGFLTEREIPLGQLEYYSEGTGRFEPEGPRQKVHPSRNQYPFEKMVLLVGPACYSACEIEAYAFSQVPGMVTVGQYPTAGVEAEVARGQFKLPEGFLLQIPTGRFTLPDGSIFLEGTGVVPTLQVPVDQTTVMSPDDVVLQTGIQAVLRPLGAELIPAGPPTLAAEKESASALASQTPFLEDAAREQYEDSHFFVPGTAAYTIALNESETLIWAYAWCAADAETLGQNFQNIELHFMLDGKPISLDQMNTYDVQANNGRECRLIYTALSDWPAGEHHLTTRASFKISINDGSREYEAGDYILEYTVYVRP